ncbi:DNA primase small subunit, putative [Theileria equi strain WA]|uniref:DNA primase n=1 Tax=Theileria equi strain WA TaxID=1537102 RepID=L0AYF3_THEEQ|nr:DNA primase small subunit, putative [Theileria equi strain WA]AFZ80622.1 DNA primase small subunit, putative [Theileria equi strain WA]|eukprot:XP_004830288.1 DNA primase small subunit, putative [Theileria equi strain WA]
MVSTIKQRSSEGEWGAHNPQARGSKPRAASFLFAHFSIIPEAVWLCIDVTSTPPCFYISTMPISDDSIVTEANLRFYYKHLCPVKELIRWVSYEDSNVLCKREISLTYQRETSSDTNEVYIRWQTYEGVDQFYQTLCERDTVPFKFDIGAIYNRRVSLMQLSGGDFRAVERELVFDIDMDDYDEFRTCCTEKKICRKCWRFIRIAVELITKTLQVDFGYKDILWVYSGRRGIHCWVCDKRARELPSDGRIAIIEYLNLITGGDGYVKKVSLFSCEQHPLVQRSFDVCYSNFKDLLVEQNLLSLKHLPTILEYIPEKQQHARKLIQDAINGGSRDSLSLFNQLCDSLSLPNPHEYQSKRDPSVFPYYFIEIVIAFSYPRLDVNVTKDIGHLLKSPFCVHAKTGRICVPVDHEHIDKFYPENVPTVG